MDTGAIEETAQAEPVVQGEDSGGHGHLTASFGVVMDVVNDARRPTINDDLTRDPSGEARLAQKPILWLAKRGEPIPKTGVKHKFDWSMDRENLDTPRRIQVVTSDLPSAKLPHSLSLKHDGVRQLCWLECWPDAEDVRSLNEWIRNRRFYPRKHRYLDFRYQQRVQFEFDPRTEKLSITALNAYGTPSQRWRVIWMDPGDLNDGCSVISVPPPMYSLMRPESFASSLFRKSASEGSREDDETEEAESAPRASTRHLEDSGECGGN